MPGNIIHSYHDIMRHYNHPGQVSFGELAYNQGYRVGCCLDNTYFPRVRRVLVVIDVGYRISSSNSSLCGDFSGQSIANVISPLFTGTNANCIFLAVDQAGNMIHPQIIANTCGAPVFAPQGNIIIRFHPNNNANPTQCVLIKDPNNRIKYFWPQI
ncbi:hypothetical protein [Xenorhabdus taiwanensis]|uniref:Uncharacterized protein n=1 Tax=Xenorhabdus taiwanensis TaxID=3085177 RepID=A0ABM8JZ76_9GAMM|nr:hypothetical protein TCT1_27000 [Xenorhabdus sp. TCT-1]